MVLGSIVLQGKASSLVSSVSYRSQSLGDPGEGGFLGMAHGPFRLVGGKGDSTSTQSAENMVLRDPAQNDCRIANNFVRP